MEGNRDPKIKETEEERIIRISRQSAYMAIGDAITLTPGQKADLQSLLGLSGADADDVARHIEAELSIYAFRYAMEQEVLKQRDMVRHARKLQDKLEEVDILLRDLPGPMREVVGIWSVNDSLDIDRLRDGMEDLRVALDSGLGKAGGAGRPKNHALYALVSRMLVVFAAYSEEPPQYWWDGMTGEWDGNFRQFVDVALPDVMRVANSSLSGIIKTVRQQITARYLAHEADRLRKSLPGA